MQTALDHQHDQVAVSGEHGIGVVFEHIDHKDAQQSSVRIKSLVAFGAADRSKKLKVGDQLLSVDGEDVNALSMDTLRSRCLGGSGTDINMKIRRNGKDESVDMKRGKAGYWALVDELEAIKAQMATAEDATAAALKALEKERAELQKLQKELEELKKRCQASLDDQLKAENTAKTRTEERDRALSEVARLEDVIKGLHEQVKAAEERARAAEIETMRKQKDAEQEARLRTQAEEREAKAQAALLEEVHLRKEFQNDNAVLTARLAEAAEKIKPLPEYVSRNIALEAEVAELRSNLAHSETESNARKQLLDRLQDDYKNLKAAHAVLDSKYASSEAELATAQAEGKRLQADLKGAQDRYVDAKGQLESTLSENRVAQQEVANSKQLLSQIEASHGTSQAEGQEMKSQLEQERAERMQLETMLKATSERKMALITEMSQLRDKLRQIEVQNDSIVTKNKDLEAQLSKLPELKASILELQSEKRTGDDVQEELKAETARLKQSEKRVRGELEAALGNIETLLSQINALKLADAHKLADMERRINEDVYFLTQERDNYKMELDRYYGLPNPCGVGMLLEENVQVSRTSGTTKTLNIKKLIDGMSAHMSGKICVGHGVLEIDGITTLGMTLDDMKAKIAGPRGSRVTLKMLIPPQDANSAGVEYVVTLKRGAWGAEHCVVAPEDQDFLDKGKWPVPGALSKPEFDITDIDRHEIQSAPPQQQ